MANGNDPGGGPAPASAGWSGTPRVHGVHDRPIDPRWAAGWGFALLFVTAACSAGVFWEALRQSSAPVHLATGVVQVPLAPIGLGVLCGFALLVISFAGLVLLFKALGLDNPGAALGLPSGSIRALLALGLVIVFVSVATWELIADSASDPAKQILTISATAFTTVVGFYFGSNASSDAARTMAQITSQMAGPNADAGPPPTDPASLPRKVSAIRTLADAASKKLVELSDPPLDKLKDEVTAARPSGSSDFDHANDAFQRMTTKANACSTDADRAEDALKTAQKMDAATLSAATARIDQLGQDCVTANHDFQTAVADFVAARDAVLKSIAKG